MLSSVALALALAVALAVALARIIEMKVLHWDYSTPHRSENVYVDHHLPRTPRSPSASRVKERLADGDGQEGRRGAS